MIKSPILIVDDQPENLAAMRQVLEEYYPLAFATRGQQALDAAKKLIPSLILLDIQMPDMDGYEVCRALKEDESTSHIPIIFVTTLNHNVDEKLAFDYGAVDFINKPFSAPILKARVRNHLNLVQAKRLEKSYQAAINMLALAGHHNDEDTGAHIWRMAAYAGVIARAAGWSEEDCRTLVQAAPMHDTGKIGIPESILRKPAKLDEAEWVVMRQHPQMGYDILIQGDAPVFQLAAEVSLRHHEKWNGEGYPGKLKGEEIPESARIVALADVFDALTMRRPYKEPWPVEKAMAFIHEQSGIHFDPNLVAVMDSVMPEILEHKAHWEQVEATQSD